MAKGYWIARVDVHNDEGYKPYALANPGIFKKFGGRFVVRGGKFEGVEGTSRSRNVVIEFPDGMHEYVTTPVKRVLRIAGREIFYIETINSRYRLEVRGREEAVAESTG